MKTISPLAELKKLVFGFDVRRGDAHATLGKVNAILAGVPKESKPRTPLTCWLASAQSGDRFLALGFTDVHVVSYARRAKREVTTELVTVVFGPAVAPRAESAILVTMESLK